MSRRTADHLFNFLPSILRLRSNIFLLKTMRNEIRFSLRHTIYASRPRDETLSVFAYAYVNRSRMLKARKDYGHKKAMSHVVAWRWRARQFPRPIIIWAATPAASRAAPPRAFPASQTEAPRINILTPGGALFSLNRARVAAPRVAIITGVAARRRRDGGASAYKPTSATRSGRTSEAERPVTTGKGISP